MATIKTILTFFPFFIIAFFPLTMSTKMVLSFFMTVILTFVIPFSIDFFIVLFLGSWFLIFQIHMMLPDDHHKKTFTFKKNKKNKD